MTRIELNNKYGAIEYGAGKGLIGLQITPQNGGGYIQLTPLEAAKLCNILAEYAFEESLRRVEMLRENIDGDPVFNGTVFKEIANIRPSYFESSALGAIQYADLIERFLPDKAKEAPVKDGDDSWMDAPPSIEWRRGPAGGGEGTGGGDEWIDGERLLVVLETTVGKQYFVVLVNSDGDEMYFYCDDGTVLDFEGIDVAWWARIQQTTLKDIQPKRRNE